MAKAEPKAKNKGGRPGKLTPELQDLICKHLESGCYLETAAAVAGVVKQTLHGWLRRAAKGEPEYIAFREAVEAAQAGADSENVETIRQASKKDWRAAAWRLERKHQKRWGTVQRHEVSGPEGKAVEVKQVAMDLSSLSAEELIAFRSLLAKIKGPADIETPDDRGD